MAVVKIFWTQTAIKQRDYILKYSEIFIAGFWDNRQDPGKLLKFLRGKND